MDLVKILSGLWDAIDISNNIQKADTHAQTIKRGIETWVHIAAYGLLAIICGVLAWYFDLTATWTATEIFRRQVMEDLPPMAGEITGVLILSLTLAPTLFEIFGAGLAKRGVKFIQIAVVALCAFDAVTDMPRVTIFLNGHKAYFDEIPIVLSQVTYAFCYISTLFLATFGFELTFVIFMYLVVYLIFAEFFNKTPQKNVMPNGRNGGIGIGGGN